VGSEGAQEHGYFIGGIFKRMELGESLSMSWICWISDRLFVVKSLSSTGISKLLLSAAI